MFNPDKEIKEWKKLLDSQSIDETTYNREVDRVIMGALMEKSRNTTQNSTVLKMCLITCFILIVLIILCIYFYTPKSINTAFDLDNIGKPLQSFTSGGTTMLVNGKNVDIKYIATYSIAGRVVDVQNYYGYDLQNSTSPKDIGISWGFLAKDANNDKITWTSSGNRFLYYHTTNIDWLNSIGGTNSINKHFSNNHLIPSDSKINNLISNIKKGDYIKINGYLVNIYCETGNGGYFYWNSSTSRNDIGNGACELIFVTNVTWLTN